MWHAYRLWVIPIEGDQRTDPKLVGTCFVYGNSVIIFINENVFFEKVHAFGYLQEM